MSRTIFLTIQDDEVVALNDFDTRIPLEEITDDDIVLCSSSMDFPEEYTQNKQTIALARQIRG